MRHPLAALPLLLAALPVAAAEPTVGTIGPYIPVDASSETVMFIDSGARDSYQSYAMDVVVIMSRDADGKPEAMIGGVKIDCKTNAMTLTSKASIDENGRQGPVEYIKNDLEVQKDGSLGDAVVKTVCTGTSPNESAAGMEFDTFAKLWAFGAEFLASQAPK